MRYTAIILILLFVLSGGGLWAQATTIPDVSTKFAFINSTAILQGTAEGKKELGELEGFINDRRTKLETESKELDQINSSTTVNPEC